MCDQEFIEKVSFLPITSFLLDNSGFSASIKLQNSLKSPTILKFKLSVLTLSLLYLSFIFCPDFYSLAGSNSKIFKNQRIK